MYSDLFKGLFDTSTTSVISIQNFLICLFSSLLIGICFAAIYTYKNRYTQSFVMTLALLPAVVCVVIMMVNGNLGTGVAVARAFGLVRFRSAPGTAKEICALFLAMGAGLILGMGYIGYGLLYTIILSSFMLIYTYFSLSKKEKMRILRITIPESLDYTGKFDDLITSYTIKNELIQVKTTNMGSLFKLTYHIVLKKDVNEKEFIDQLRCRNGNLEIEISYQETNPYEL